MNVYKLSVLKQHRIITSEFCRSWVWHESHCIVIKRRVAFLSGCLRQKSVSIFLLTSGKQPGSRIFFPAGIIFSMYVEFMQFPSRMFICQCHRKPRTKNKQEEKVWCKAFSDCTCVKLAAAIRNRLLKQWLD